jgi:Zn-dependent M28 family amino/carboxypeptidase
VVFVGAHLDSWHTATGATDNADGAATAMEAMRILTALEVQPRRTIRVALWSGEEQGLLGARAYVAKHLQDEAARGRISVYLNDDPGTGATYGFYMQENEAAKRIFDAWLEPLRIPAFTVIKDFHNYDVRMRHTNADLADAVNVEDLKRSAVVLAVFTWHAAMRAERIPRARQ